MLPLVQGWPQALMRVRRHLVMKIGRALNLWLAYSIFFHSYLAPKYLNYLILLVNFLALVILRQGQHRLVPLLI